MNKYAPHVYVIPEDDCNRQLADGFLLHHQVKDNRIQVMPPAGGWAKVLKTFRDEYLPKLREYPQSHVVMLIDFDDQVKVRAAAFAKEIPEDFKCRVFVVGSKITPEALRAAMKIGYEKIGQALADDCAGGSTEHWDHDQLSHNDEERQRLVKIVKPFLF